MADSSQTVNPYTLEAEIRAADRQVQKHYLAGERDLAREWAQRMADLIARRTPETVEQMEREAGLE